MSANSDKYQMHGVKLWHGATAQSGSDGFQRGPPPPSYEECLKMKGTVGIAAHQFAYSNPAPYQQQQAFHHPPTYAAPGPSALPCGYANPYQTHIQQQQQFYNTLPASLHSGIPTAAKNVLYLAKGAKVRTTASGAISIPPPPPGCAPSLGQMAAMSGQPVIIKKQKRSFF